MKYGYIRGGDIAAKRKALIAYGVPADKIDAIEVIKRNRCGTFAQDWPRLSLLLEMMRPGASLHMVEFDDLGTLNDALYVMAQVGKVGAAVYVGNDGLNYAIPKDAAEQVARTTAALVKHFGRKKTAAATAARAANRKPGFFEDMKVRKPCLHAELMAIWATAGITWISAADQINAALDHARWRGKRKMSYGSIRKHFGPKGDAERAAEGQQPTRRPDGDDWADA